MKHSLAEQLASLKDKRAGGSPDAAWLSATRETLLMQARNTISSAAPRTGLRALREGLALLAPSSWTRFAAVPIAAFLLMASAAGAGSAVMTAAQNTLPGDSLYGVKLAIERVSLRTVTPPVRTERRIEVAGRRLEEMVRLSAGADARKEEKIAEVSGRFAGEMNAIRRELAHFQENDDAEAGVRTALRIDAKADEYRRVFSSGTLMGRPAFRMALLSLDQASVTALEVLVEKQAIASEVLPEAQLTSTVGKRIETFEAHVAVAESRLNAETVPTEEALALAARAKEAVEEAKELFSQGDFKAAVRKVSEGAELVSEAETTESKEEPPVESVTSTPETAADASTSTPAAENEPEPDP